MHVNGGRGDPRYLCYRIHLAADGRDEAVLLSALYVFLTGGGEDVSPATRLERLLTFGRDVIELERAAAEQVTF